MSLSDFSLDKKTAIVTGASRGIGKAISLALASAGANVVLASRTREALEDIKSEIISIGRQSLAVVVDINEDKDIEALVSRTMEVFGKIDILVNNAGVAMVKPLVPIPGFVPKGPKPEFFEPTSDDEWHYVLNSNLTSAFKCMRAVAPYMLDQKWGRIINISSVEGLRGVQLHSLYCTSKAGMEGLTRSLALEWARSNITVNAIAPGAFHTDMMAPEFEDEKLRSKLLKSIPMKRGGEVREIGALAVYLSSEVSSYVTGQTIAIDGGLTTSMGR